MTDGEAGIRLRPYADGDLWIQQRFLGDPVATQWLGGPETDAQIERRHRIYLAMADPAEGSMCTIELDETPPTPAGTVGWWEHALDDGRRVWEIGWYVLPEQQGRGVATTATRLAIAAAWAANRRPVHAWPNVENGASNAICAKVGMRLIGPVELEFPKGHWMTCNDWVIDPPLA